jgi:hypothetical protein
MEFIAGATIIGLLLIWRKISIPARIAALGLIVAFYAAGWLTR